VKAQLIKHIYTEIEVINGLLALKARMIAKHDNAEFT
jgi:hypothetical protein